MDTFFKKLGLVATDSTLLRKIAFVIGGLVVFRLLAAIPVPGVSTTALAQFLANNQFLGFLSIFSGGGLSSLSLVMLGVGPYITATIIMQLLTIVFPNVKSMYQEEGESGRKRFAQYARLLTVPLAFVQGFSFLFLLEKQGVAAALSPVMLGENLIIIVAGALLLMWIGELMTEFGVGNGMSLIIFAGIVGRLPTALSQLAVAYDPSQIPIYVAFVVAALAVIYGVVMMTEAERPVPITYAKQVHGGRATGGVSTYLPLRLNQAGVIPIIFALSILIFPQLILTFLAKTSIVWVATLATNLLAIPGGAILYGVSYFVLVFIFTFFYTAITFEPHQVAENLQKSGAFIPGVRPGAQTEDYIGRIVTRITLIGAVFLGVVAVLPIAMQAVTHFRALAIGGTALLIVVSVILDLIRKIDAQVSLREY